MRILSFILGAAVGALGTIAYSKKDEIIDYVNDLVESSKDGLEELEEEITKVKNEISKDNENEGSN